MGLTLGELVDLPGYGLRLLIGGETARARTVEGVHCIEHLDPVPWLEEGWVMMTTGAQLRDGEASQRLLVERLSEGGMTALGIGLGAYLPDVPPALLAEAEARDFPVFTTPYEASFREIVTYVNQSVMSHDLYVLRRLTWMQQYLLEALHEASPEQVLVDRLSHLLGDTPIRYADPDGRALATAGGALNWGELGPYCEPGGIREHAIPGRWAIAAPVLDGRTAGGWLVAAARSRPLDRHVTKQLFESAANLLALLRSARRGAAGARLESLHRTAMRALRVAHGEEDPALATELAREGVDFTRPCRLVAGEARNRARSAERDGTAALAAFDELVRQDGVDAVTTAYDRRALMIAQREPDGWEDWLAQVAPPLVVGVSEPFVRVEELAAALAQAELALVVASTLPGAHGPIRRHEDLDPEILLVAEARSPAVQARLDAVVAPLADDPPLLEAVEAYFAAGFDVGHAAATLHLHRNSLRNRLVRAEEQLGRPLRSPSTIASLHLALIARNLNGHRPGPSSPPADGPT